MTEEREAIARQALLQACDTGAAKVYAREARWILDRLAELAMLRVALGPVQRTSASHATDNGMCTPATGPRLSCGCLRCHEWRKAFP